MFKEPLHPAFNRRTARITPLEAAEEIQRGVSPVRVRGAELCPVGA